MLFGIGKCNHPSHTGMTEGGHALTYGTMIAVSRRASTTIPVTKRSSNWPGIGRQYVHYFIRGLCLNLGGDSDTIGAMTGAIVGAYYGARALPQRWLDTLENGEKGRDYVTSLADQLFCRIAQ